MIDQTVQTTSDDIANVNFAPRADWTTMSDTEHFVQFYEADGFLLNSLSGFIGTAINSGDAAVVIGTQAHRDGLDELLLANGVDVVGAKTSGRYVVLDATETLAKFMVDGVPEAARFNEVIGSLILSISNGGGARVRAFGEMVALLWADGNYNGAIRLEELWNDLQKVHSFSLFCAYPMSGLDRKQFTTSHAEVCSTHSRVIPAESYADIPSADARLRAIAQLQQRAQSLTAEIEERQQVEQKLRNVMQELEVQLAEREELLTRAQVARAEAETANRMKDEFLATVSHELRTPLNAIIGWSHLIKSGSLDEATISRAVETIDRNAKSQAQLIEDILDVSRMITGKLRLNSQPVDITSVINAAIDSVQLAIDSKDINLALTLDPTARHTLGDSNRLQQVIWNLLANAIKFTPSGGHIEVKVERNGAQLQIQISDNGQGISPIFLPFIFDRFRQADGTTTRMHGGLGLGLSIVRHLVELHGGSIKAESAGEGQGATFKLWLPLASKEQHSQERKRVNDVSRKHLTTEVGPLPSLEDVKILLVDDDHDTLQILSVILEESKATVQIASSVSEALEVVQWFNPDVLVSDLAMPGEDGYSLISKLRALESPRQTSPLEGRTTSSLTRKQTGDISGKGGRELRGIPAVALTSYVRVEDRARALSAGFNMFVPKPVQPDELITAIANLAEEPLN